MFLLMESRHDAKKNRPKEKPFETDALWTLYTEYSIQLAGVRPDLTREMKSE